MTRPPCSCSRPPTCGEALVQAARDFRAAGGDSIVLVFGSTGDLSTQLANGAPGDLFLAANEAEIAALAARGLVVDSTRTVYAVGRLALLTRCAGSTAIPDRTTVPEQSGVDTMRSTASCTPLAPADLARDSIRTVAIADPRYAPYGRAAQQVLERSGLWDAVQPKLVMGSQRVPGRAVRQHRQRRRRLRLALTRGRSARPRVRGRGHGAARSAGTGRCGDAACGQCIGATAFLRFLRGSRRCGRARSLRILGARRRVLLGAGAGAVALTMPATQATAWFQRYSCA